MDDDDDSLDTGGAAGSCAPAKAVAAAAQIQEQAYVTVGRALETVVHMLRSRGFTPTMFATSAGFVPLNPPTHEQALTVVKAEFYSAERCHEAEAFNEILMEAQVLGRPDPYTTAHALGLPAGTRIMVAIISTGNVKVIRDIMDTMSKQDIQRAVILHRSPLTPYAKKFLTELNPAEVLIEPFLLSEVQKPIDRSNLVPKHIPLTPATASAVVARYGKQDTYPRLLTRDPMVRFLGLPKGTMVLVRECMYRTVASYTFFVVTDV